MQRFHFNIRDGQVIEDPSGETLPDRRAAQSAAIAILSEILPKRLDDLLPEGRLSIDVTDDAGDLVFSVLTTVAVHQGA